MVLKLMSPRGVGSIITADYIQQVVTVENYTDEILDTAFGVNKNPTWKDFEDFLEDRCFPRTRHYMKWILQDLGLQFYDPLAIIRKTNGRMAEDDLWIEIVEDLGEYKHD